MHATRGEGKYDQVLLAPIHVHSSRRTQKLLSVFNRYPGHSFQHASLISFPESIPPVQTFHCRQTQIVIALSDNLAHFPWAHVVGHAPFALLSFNQVVIVSCNLYEDIDWCRRWTIRSSVNVFPRLCEMHVESLLEAREKVAGFDKLIEQIIISGRVRKK